MTFSNHVKRADAATLAAHVDPSCSDPHPPTLSACSFFSSIRRNAVESIQRGLMLHSSKATTAETRDLKRFPRRFLSSSATVQCQLFLGSDEDSCRLSVSVSPHPFPFILLGSHPHPSPVRSFRLRAHSALFLFPNPDLYHLLCTISSSSILSPQDWAF